jgi:hypothetical protein
MHGAGEALLMAIATAFLVALTVTFRKNFRWALLSGALIGLTLFLIWLPISVWPYLAPIVLPCTLISAALGAWLGLLISRRKRS